MLRVIAVEMLFALKFFDAQRFYDLRIINEVVNEDRLIERAEERANDLLQKGHLFLMGMKELINSDPNYEEKLSIPLQRIVPVVNSEDTKEAVRAFVEKRMPEWKLK